jgi:hypothetical protein
MPKKLGVDYEKVKVEVAAVVRFNKAHGLTAYSRAQLAQFFGITTESLRNWFPTTSSQTSQPAQRTKNNQIENISSGLKRARSEDSTEEPSSAPSTFPSSQQPSTPLRRKPVRNGGRAQKKLKTEEGVSKSTPPADSSSPPPPQQLLTPPRRKIAQPRKKTGSQPGRRPEPTNYVTYHNTGGWEDDDYVGV